MPSEINPRVPADGKAAVKAEMRANFAAARREIEALQADIAGRGALSAKDRATVPDDLAAAGAADGGTFLRGDGRWARPLPEEVVVAGARVLAPRDLGSLLTYTGSGDVWTLPKLGQGGEIAVENDGTGPLTLAPADGTAIVNSVCAIAPGKSASLRFFGGGRKVKVFVEA